MKREFQAGQPRNALRRMATLLLGLSMQTHAKATKGGTQDAVTTKEPSPAADQEKERGEQAFATACPACAQHARMHQLRVFILHESMHHTLAALEAPLPRGFRALAFPHRLEYLLSRSKGHAAASSI